MRPEAAQSARPDQAIWSQTMIKKQSNQSQSGEDSSQSAHREATEKRQLNSANDTGPTGIVVAHYGEEFGVLPLGSRGENMNEVQPVRGILPGRFLMLPPMGWEELMEAGEVMPAVGDLVNYRQIDTMVLIESVGRRRSLLSRKQAGQSYGMQLMAANVDLMFVVMPVDRPLSHGGLLRYITLAGDIPVHLVITKCDLDYERALELKDDASRFISSIHLVTAKSDLETGDGSVEHPDSPESKESTGEGAPAILNPGDLVDAIRNLRPTDEAGPPIPLVCFLGPSGAGKSTLVNSMLGRAMQETSAISEATGKGRHTTVRRDWIWHEEGFGILDTPGMRELGLDRMETGGAFSRIEELAHECRFRDCSHEQEQGCAVREAVKRGEIPADLLEQFQRLRKEVQIVEDFRKTRKKSVADESKEALRQSKEKWMKDIHQQYRKRKKERG
ncbi:MAG TPA: ribosome small subunit-dependent GTPase A [Leptospiraceae bacterium]|nr:ribosome small subunit-dependent GTPase A [Spirochaetaceae bacterium]HBS06145.1 ribosome small subunit-dependent GTPase A [Leptospiraceae bacterium]|tara:strand:- start:67075 stop:68409 length:1335 start_codon:yes stop_codon:yes gene_type:complete